MTTLQDYRQLVYRSLGVPDAVTDVKHDRFPWTHRELVAALNLAKRAGVEPVAKWNDLADFGHALIKDIIATLEAGGLDIVLADLGDYMLLDIYQREMIESNMVVEHFDRFSGPNEETVKLMVRTLIDSVVHYVRCHPVTPEHLSSVVVSWSTPRPSLD